MADKDFDDVNLAEDTDLFPFVPEELKVMAIPRVATVKTTNSMMLTIGYENTDFEREYKFSGISTAALSSIEANVNAYNTNIPAADKAVFISDDGNQMTSITGAKYSVVTETYIIER